MLVPLDNYICKGTQVFLTSKNPDYLASVYQVGGGAGEGLLL